MNVFYSFLDELEKIAAARKRMTVAQSRQGRRPMRVDTMLKKDKEGTLYKAADAGSEQARLEYQEMEPGKLTGRMAVPQNKKGDVPSREDIVSKPRAENRQDITRASLHNAEAFQSPEGLEGY